MLDAVPLSAEKLPLLAALALSMSLNGFCAGEDGPVKLQDLRALFQKEVEAHVKPQMEKYRTQLAGLESALAAERDYEGAIKVREEREKLEKRLAGLMKKSDDAPAQPYAGGPITLTAKSAILAGGVAYDEKKDCLNGWKAKGASAQWSLPAPLKAGGYEVILELACAPGSGGSLTLRDERFSLTTKVTPTKGWEDYGSMSLGTLKLRATSTGLNLGALTIEGDGLFHLRCVKLIPAKTSE